VNANPKVDLAGHGLLPGIVNYYLGRDRSRWHTAIPTYAQVQYTNLFPGVDAVFYGGGQDGRQIEHDFVLAPGVDPDAITLRAQGTHQLEIAPEGDLVARVTGTEIRLRKPAIYQRVNGAHGNAGHHQTGLPQAEAAVHTTHELHEAHQHKACMHGRTTHGGINL
jgi:hypothetical protein